MHSPLTFSGISTEVFGAGTSISTSQPLLWGATISFTVSADPMQPHVHQSFGTVLRLSVKLLAPNDIYQLKQPSHSRVWHYSRIVNE